MTLEKICGLTLDEIEKMSDLELDKHFSPMFNVTRPTKESIEKAKKQLEDGGSSTGGSKKQSLSQKKKEAIALAKNMGLDLGI